MRVSLGPVPYHWPRHELLDFYERVATSQAAVVYVGETVCSKRRELTPDDWFDVAARLTEAGKEVVVSTLTLIEAASELSTVERLTRQQDFLVEANDLGAVQLLAEQGREFVAGSAINIYSARTLEILRQSGLRRWVAPVELDRAAIAGILDEAGLEGDIETEVLGHGHLPLAYSARCFTARAADLPKDRCGFRCIEHPTGLPVHTQDGRRAFTINGIQTQSGAVCDLCDLWADMAAAGVDIFRVSAEGAISLQVVDEMAEAIREERRPVPIQIDEPTCRGYWLGKAGMDESAESAS